MILAGGCPQRCLVKAGSGNLKALLTLVLVAIVSLMTLRGAFARCAPAAWTPREHAPRLAGPGRRARRAASRCPRCCCVAGHGRGRLGGAGAGLAGARAARARALDRRHRRGLLVAAAFYLTGTSATSPSTRRRWSPPGWHAVEAAGGPVLRGTAGACPRPADLWTDKSTVATFGVTLALGVLLGAFASAKLRGDFRLESFQTPRELGAHAAGAVLMGFGGVTALGCSLGQRRDGHRPALVRSGPGCPGDLGGCLVRLGTAAPGG